MLEIINFSKAYVPGKNVVNNINLKVENGDIYGFIGHNGAGKSTTIKAIVGALEFEKGDIKINGISMKKDPVACKSIMAYIPDNPDLYEHLSGIQYLNFIADIYQVSGRHREERIKKYSEMFQIKGSLGDLISSYSHGMKQKIAIISALVHNPKLLVLDEPFVGLDPKAAHTLKEIMNEFCQEGNSIFFSTHVLEVAEKLCNKVAIIKDGEIIASGNTGEVRGRLSLEDVFMELVEDENI